MTYNQDVPLAGAPRLYEMTISLMDAGVDIERRVLAPEHCTLADLHLIIQAAMGWTDAHLHEFTSRDGTMYGHPRIDELDFADEAGALIGEVLCEPGEALRYVYDFGDYWVHRSNSLRSGPATGRLSPPASAVAARVPPRTAAASTGTRNCVKRWPTRTHPNTRS